MVFVKANDDMHARQMAEVAGWLSACSELVSRGIVPVEADRGMRYWTASKCRLQCWQAALKVFEDDLADPCEMHDPWHAIEVVIQEILVSDLLTRVWTAILVQHDQQTGHQELQSIGYSVFIGHLELRSRAMRLMLHHRAAEQQAYDRLDQVRRRMERWTDLLLSRIANLEIAAQFGFEEHRVRDFAADRPLEDHTRRRQMETLLQASLAAALNRDLSSCPANPDLNAEIIAGILECFPEDRFDSVGLPKGLLHWQLEQSQRDVEQVLQSLMDEENA